MSSTSFAVSLLTAENYTSAFAIASCDGKCWETLQFSLTPYCSVMSSWTSRLFCCNLYCKPFFSCRNIWDMLRTRIFRRNRLRCDCCACNCASLTLACMSFYFRLCCVSEYFCFNYARAVYFSRRESICAKRDLFLDTNSRYFDYFS